MAGQVKENASRVRFDERGLAPCVIQDSRSGEVLMLAYLNEEALRLTLETGEVHLYSRSRDEIWHKGASSGNFQRVTQLRYDCDGDAANDKGDVIECALPPIAATSRCGVGRFLTRTEVGEQRLESR
jgi:phosphoribosyl-AMP cyclohydrolase